MRNGGTAYASAHKKRTGRTRYIMPYAKTLSRGLGAFLFAHTPERLRQALDHVLAIGQRHAKPCQCPDFSLQIVEENVPHDDLSALLIGHRFLVCGDCQATSRTLATRGKIAAIGPHQRPGDRTPANLPRFQSILIIRYQLRRNASAHANRLTQHRTPDLRRRLRGTGTAHCAI
ncbi:hypothetical protein HYPGJ_30528 [Hyphomicrobium sp. GJ21]|nr:hypothetical protein HYPGJ_30528 [Hyphomicrobium sp. GJ21]